MCQFANLRQIGFWNFLSKENLPPAALPKVASNLDILCSLQIVSKHHLEVSNGRFEVDIYYVSLTDLGVQFLSKCDYELGRNRCTRPSGETAGA
jgi:hypothetical protein